MMRVAAVTAVVAAIACSATAASFSSDEEILAHARAHIDELPEPVQRDLTIENLRKWLTVSHVEISRPEDAVGGDEIDPAVVWRIGKDVWDIIADNTPVVNATIDYGGAVPKGISDWTKLSGWKDQQTQMYTFKFKNFANMLLTEYQWLFAWKYGGSYEGKGQYITEAGAVTKKIYAITTEHVDVHANAFNPVNYGTTTNPIGGLDLQVTMSSHGYFKKTVVGCHIIARGDGSSKVVTCDQN